MSQVYLNDESVIKKFRAIAQGYTRTAVCGRKYVLVDSLAQWLKSAVQPDSTTTQASRLLEAVYRFHPEPGDPITPEKLEGCLVVFSILLSLGKGDLIHHFRRYQIDDRHLPIPLATLQVRISKMRLCADHAHGLASKFNETQWRFCPVKFDLDMDRECVQDDIIPICRKSRINKKGGTSEVWVVDVYDEFVTEELRNKLSASRYQPPEEPSRWRYQFALKTFKEGWRATYENEKKAFQGLRDHQGMVKYLGDYSHTGHREAETPTVITTTHNILLEYGELDLQEFFVHRSPPILKSEVEAFWKDISDVAIALEGIHNLKTKKYEGYEEYHGWHADIKPDNILIVQGKFKLADPGFATFIRANKSDPDPKTILLGGTTTYAAPECRNSKTRDSISAVPQTIDTWSLGCVFSVAASWVALDEQGIKQFRTIRKKAIQKIFEKRPDSEDALRKENADPVKGDYFHDGQNVLDDVIGWHKYLRLTLRQTDTITSRVLDLVERGMLVANPKERMKAKKVCEELSKIMKESEESASEVVPLSILDSLCEMDEGATSNALTSGLPSLSPPEGQALTVSNKRQAANSRLLDPSIMKTAHRSDYRKSSVYSQILPNEQADAHPASVRVPELRMPIWTNRIPLEMNHAQIEDQDFTENFIRQQSFESERRVSNPSKRPTYRNVFQAREEIQKRSEEEKQKNRMKSLNPFKNKPEDPLLSSYFLTRKRDIKFLVDNGSTMSDWWFEASYLLETLLMKLEGLDKNGMDLSFTLGPVTVQNNKSIPDFMKAMKEARPPQGSMHATDMRASLGNILDHYVNEVERKHRSRGTDPAKDLTILVLTDGIWEGTTEKQEVNKTIVKFLKRLKAIKGDLSHRPASIEFIQFGNDDDATFRLRQLDDNLLKWEGIEDIVDTEHSQGDVNKMILGSFVECFDKEDDDEEVINEDRSPSPPEISPHSMSQMSSLDRTSRLPLMSHLDGQQLSLQTSPESIASGPLQPPIRTPTRRSSSRNARHLSGLFNMGPDASDSYSKGKQRAP